MLVTFPDLSAQQLLRWGDGVSLACAVSSKPRLAAGEHCLLFPGFNSADLSPGLSVLELIFFPFQKTKKIDYF